MMENKYRAWSDEAKRMYSWEELIGSKETLYDCFTLTNIYTLMKYIGFKDKNGKEIYEGDVIEAWSQGSKGRGVVKCRINEGITGVEVIGNIYENPELLTG